MFVIVTTAYIEMSSSHLGYMLRSVKVSPCRYLLLYNISIWIQFSERNERLVLVP